MVNPSTNVSQSWKYLRERRIFCLSAPGRGMFDRITGSFVLHPLSLYHKASYSLSRCNELHSLDSQDVEHLQIHDIDTFSCAPLWFALGVPLGVNIVCKRYCESCSFFHTLAPMKPLRATCLLPKYAYSLREN